VFHISIWGAWNFVWGAKPQNAVATGLVCLSVKLHLRRFLFMQYKITWLVTVEEYIYAGWWEYVIRFNSDI